MKWPTARCQDCECKESGDTETHRANERAREELPSNFQSFKWRAKEESAESLRCSRSDPSKGLCRLRLRPVSTQHPAGEPMRRAAPHISANSSSATEKDQCACVQAVNSIVPSARVKPQKSNDKYKKMKSSMYLEALNVI